MFVKITKEEKERKKGEKDVDNEGEDVVFYSSAQGTGP